jgi:phosphoribosyl 1,2-cyclic phosphodiesterase
LLKVGFFVLFMSLYITSLNSGSNGNCYYVGNGHEAVLVDAGISCREVEKHMARLGLSIETIKAIFISHEHSDHIAGLRTLVKRFKLPVYITPRTLGGCRFSLEPQLVKNFTGDSPITIGSLSVTAFKKYHDAHDPYSFTVSCNDVHVGVFTDIGTPCAQLIQHFKQCHAAFLEANYDEEMLEKGDYPYHLKRRIRGGNGHLSNKQALEVFTSHRPPFMSHLLLAHLSKNNNCPILVGELFNAHANGVQVVVASRYEETPVYHITASAAGSSVVTNVPALKTKSAPQLAFEFA